MRLPLVVEATWLVIVARVRRRRFTALALPAIVRPPRPTGWRGRDGEERLITAAQRALRWAEYMVPGRLSCLQRTVALHRLLLRRGIATRPQIGVRKQREDLDVHAWLEYRDCILNGSVAHCRQYHILRPVPTAVDRLS